MITPDRVQTLFAASMFLTSHFKGRFKCEVLSILKVPTGNSETCFGQIVLQLNSVQWEFCQIVFSILFVRNLREMQCIVNLNNGK